MNQAQLIELLSQIKALLENDPEQVRQLLANYPTLSYALLHIQLVLNIVDVQTVEVFFSSFFHLFLFLVLFFFFIYYIIIILLGLC